MHMLSEMGQAHLDVYRDANTSELRARIRTIAVNCLLRAYDESGDVRFYVDMETFHQMRSTHNQRSK